jgi:hypothetical protein
MKKKKKKKKKKKTKKKKKKTKKKKSFFVPFVGMMLGILRFVTFFSPFMQMLDHGHFHLFHLHHSYFIPPVLDVQRMQFPECPTKKQKQYERNLLGNDRIIFLLSTFYKGWNT